MLCQYKNIFGKVGQGVHSYRIFNIAIVDVLLTILAAFIIHYFVPKYKVISILVFLFILGIIMHRIFCVRTTVDKLIFG
jgi:hypothetical protein